MVQVEILQTPVVLITHVGPIVVISFRMTKDYHFGNDILAACYFIKPIMLYVYIYIYIYLYLYLFVYFIHIFIN